MIPFTLIDCRRKALVEGKVITSCRCCYHHLRAHNPDRTVDDLCEETGGKLTSIFIIPADCKYLIDKK